EATRTARHIEMHAHTSGSALERWEADTEGCVGGELVRHMIRNVGTEHKDCGGHARRTGAVEVTEVQGHVLIHAPDECNVGDPSVAEQTANVAPAGVARHAVDLTVNCHAVCEVAGLIRLDRLGQSSVWHINLLI